MSCVAMFQEKANPERHLQELDLVGNLSGGMTSFSSPSSPLPPPHLKKASLSLKEASRNLGRGVMKVAYQNRRTDVRSRKSWGPCYE